MLDRIDAWIADGVLGGAQLNAADFMVAPSLALILYRSDVLPILRRPPGPRPVDRLLARARSLCTGGSVGHLLDALSTDGGDEIPGRPHAVLRRAPTRKPAASARSMRSSAERLARARTQHSTDHRSDEAGRLRGLTAGDGEHEHRECGRRFSRFGRAR